MTPDDRQRHIDHELANVARCERSKRLARRLTGPTPADLAEYDAWMNRWADRSRAIIERLEADGRE